MSVTQETIDQFVEYIKLQVFDDRYIDRQEEKRILEEGIKMGIGIEKGLAIIRQVVIEKGYGLEREIEEQAKKLLQRFAADGKVDRKEFDDAFEMFKQEVNGKLKDDEIKRRLKQIMLDNGWQAKEGGLFGSKWFSAIK
ncbi:hypothetical protein [Candidatus Albibeggiatoa sp. nov. NOAA]|uniref:hypothetical protein n=1 Tax=Candidatus Albibeggiatoa sp. nov. NOAA TaxID=3162724 RepID=UPI0032F1D940|nr:hypothetical protein [Thiotrichaceae bacterium]